MSNFNGPLHESSASQSKTISVYIVTWVHFKLVASSLPLNPRPVRSLPLVLLPLRAEGVKSGFQVPLPLVGAGIQG